MQNQFDGVPYPLQKNPLGYFYSQSGVDQIKSDLLILLLTNPGERPMLVDYGTPLRTLIFEPNDATLQATATQMIVNSISRWEPRISVNQIQVTSSINRSELNPFDDGTEINNILMIRILFYDPDNIQSVQALELQVPLPGSTT